MTTAVAPSALLPPRLTPIWIGSPNFRPGRDGHRPEAVVIHVIEGSLSAADSWFLTPESKVSAHYGIGADGTLHQYVQEENTAWHAGRVEHPTWSLLQPGKRGAGINPNVWTIGIEHEGTATSAWSDAMYERSARLVAEICVRWQIPITRERIVGHHEIYQPKSCPGAGDVDRIVKVARWRCGGVLGAGLP